MLRPDPQVVTVSAEDSASLRRGGYVLLRLVSVEHRGASRSTRRPPQIVLGRLRVTHRLGQGRGLVGAPVVLSPSPGGARVECATDLTGFVPVLDTRITLGFELFTDRGGRFEKLTRALLGGAPCTFSEGSLAAASALEDVADRLIVDALPTRDRALSPRVEVTLDGAEGIRKGTHTVTDNRAEGRFEVTFEVVHTAHRTRALGAATPWDRRLREAEDLAQSPDANARAWDRCATILDAARVLLEEDPNYLLDEANAIVNAASVRCWRALFKTEGPPPGVRRVAFSAGVSTTLPDVLRADEFESMRALLDHQAEHYLVNAAVARRNLEDLGLVPRVVSLDVREALTRPSKHPGESLADDRVNVLVRVRSDRWAPPDEARGGFEEVVRFGSILAARASRRAIEHLEADPDVLGIDLDRARASMHCAVTVPFVRADVAHTRKQYGRRAVVAVIDSGVDIRHEAFLDPKTGRTRILALWDQRDTNGPAPTALGYSFGRLYTNADIDGLLTTPGAHIPSALTDPDQHGTHVASIAAGCQTPAFAGGVAPRAGLIVVIADMTNDPHDPLSLGYSTGHIAALKFIRDFVEKHPGRPPVVVNISSGMNAGAHDGQSPLELAIDEFTGGGRAEGRVVVKSAGNERDRPGGHARVTVPQGMGDALTWRSNGSPRELDAIELWFSPSDEYRFSLTAPGGSVVEVDRRAPVGKLSLPTGEHVNLEYTVIHHDNAQSRLRIEVAASPKSGCIASGAWKLSITGLRVRSGEAIHAWIDCPPRDRAIDFVRHCDEGFTLSVPATARSAISVGSCSTASPPSVSDFSSHGPTRDGRKKPEVVAPGEGVRAATGGASHGPHQGAHASRGTSMAAPHVTGAIAILLSRRAWEIEKAQKSGHPPPRQFNAAQVSELLRTTTRTPGGAWTPEGGHGVLDVSGMLRAARKIR